MGPVFLLRRLLRLMGVVFLVSCATIPASSARGSIVRMTRKESGDFAAAWKAFASQTGLAVVAEGTPLHPLLSEAAAPDLTAGVPVEQAADQLARSFGYKVIRVERIGGAVRPQLQVVALRKQYDDPRDLPGVTFEVIAQSTQDIARLVSAFKPRLEGTKDAGPNTKLVRDSARVHTPELAPLPLGMLYNAP
jgi:hypothetical protein